MKSIPCFKSLQELLFNDKKYVEFLFENKIIKQLDKCQYCNSKVYGGESIEIKQIVFIENFKQQ